MRAQTIGAALVLAIGCGSSGSGGSTLGDASTDGTSGSGGHSASSGNGGSTTGGSAGSSTTGGSAGTASGGSGGSAGSSTDAGLMLGAADLACAELASESECISCCSDAHASWETVAPATRACVCESPGTCATQCAADYCLEQSGGPACYDCIFPTLVPGAACYAPSQAICAGNSDCLTYVDCRANCVLTLP